MTYQEKIRRSEKYIRSLRNANKQAYAEDLVCWYASGNDQLPNAIMPQCTNGLSLMAIQAVQHNFHEIWYEPF